MFNDKRAAGDGSNVAVIIIIIALFMVLYLLFVPLFFMIPTWLKSTINPGMSLNRFETMVSAIKEDIHLDAAIITDGVLTTTESAVTNFDYFPFYL